MKSCKSLTWKEFKEVWPEINSQLIESGARTITGKNGFDDVIIPAGIYSYAKLVRVLSGEVTPCE